MPETPQNAVGSAADGAPAGGDPGRTVLELLLALRAAGGLDLREIAPRADVWKWSFRAGGSPVDVVLDRNVMQVRVHHGRDEVTMRRVPDSVMRALFAKEPPPARSEAAADAALAGLRRVVADWKRGNARIFIVPPATAGHPDGWNRA